MRLDKPDLALTWGVSNFPGDLFFFFFFKEKSGLPPGGDVSLVSALTVQLCWQLVGSSGDGIGKKSRGILEIRSRRSGLASAWCVLQTSGWRNVYLGPHLCFRLQDRREGRRSDPGLSSSVVGYSDYASCRFLPVKRCVLTKALMLPNMFCTFSHPSCILSSENHLLSRWKRCVWFDTVPPCSECFACTSRLVWVIGWKVWLLF